MSCRKISAVVVAVWCGAAGAQTATSNDAKVQPPELAAPQRASLAGPLAGFALGPAEVDRGAFTLPSPMVAPAERGALQAAVFPGYSAEAGISEWGQGWQSTLAITRFRLSGDVNYLDDELTGPFGRLVRGADGYWYPAGLAQKVRVGWDNALEVITAWLPDGTVMTFGSSTKVTVAGKGTYAWQLDEVRSPTNRKTRLTWTTNASGRPFLSSVSYGGVGDAFQSRLDLAYDLLPAAFEDYRSGKRLALDQRVSKVTVLARHAVTGVFEERWRWTLGYQEEGYGPGYFLASVQQVFRSGEKPPATTYAYHLAKDRLPGVTLTSNPRINPLLATRSDLLQPSRSSTVDDEQDGRLDVEWGYDGRLYRQVDAGFVEEPLPPAPPGYSASCRRTASLANPPRTLARLRSGVGDETVYVVDAKTNASATTTYLTACERSGLPYTISAASPWTVAVSGSWVPGPTVRLVDLDRDHRPDLVRLQAGLYRAVRNTSPAGSKAAAAFSFGAEKTGALTPVFTPDTAWVQDLNGDGIPDLVGRYASGLVVWAGKGNLEFESAGRVMPLRVSGVPLTRLTDYALSFVDANRDGLSDVLLTKVVGNTALLLVNRGSGFDWVDLPGLRAVTASYSQPLVADLTGSGSTELSYALSGQGWSFALDAPGTGLLAAADDGKGTVLSFEWARAKAASGIRSRPPVLARLTVDASGAGPFTASYDYATPVTHTVGRFLVGFGEVQRTDPLATAWSSFLNDDVSAGLVQATTTRDALVPGVEKYALTGYASATLQGVPWRRAVTEESGWRNVDGSGTPVRTTSQVLAWDRDVCPSLTEKVGAAGTLSVQQTFAALAAFDRSLACLPATTVERGTHPDPSLDFRHETRVTRNAAGQTTAVDSVDGAASWALQGVGYDAAARPVTFTSPGTGVLTVGYDPATGLVSSLTRPDGTVMSTTARDPITSAMQGLRTTHGRLVFDQAFAFDGQERLVSTTDSLGGQERLAYRYPTAASPGAISVETLVDEVSGSQLHRRSRELVSGAGDAVGSASAIPEGWAFGPLTRRTRATGEVRGLRRDAAGPAVDPGLLDYAALYAGADELERTVTGAFGVATEASEAQHAGVMRRLAGSLHLDGGRVIRNQRENGLLDTTTAEDAAGQVLARWDEAGTAWTYLHDAAGRLRDVVLADGAHHRTSYDGHGRISRVVRDGVATVEFDYAPVSGLPSQKRFRSPAGAVLRKVDFTYDAAGRIALERHTDVASGATQDFRSYYDGATPAAPTLADTPGLLTAVSGDGFERRLEYRADGKVAKRVLTLGCWRRVESAPQYDLAGALRGETVAVYRPGVAAPLFTTTRWGTYDAVGRPLETWVQGAFLSRSTYGAQGRLDAVSFAAGEAMTLSYDPLTRRLVGSDQSMPGGYAATSQRLDARGLVATEQLRIGGLSLTRQLGYSPQRQLTSASDALKAWGYAFDPSGLPTRITENGVPTDLIRIGNRLTAGQLVSLFDDLGRTVARGDLALRYGPGGQLAEARRGAQAWTFVHDEGGRRLLKQAGGVPVAAYLEEGYLDEVQLVSPVKVAGRTIGVLRNGTFQMVGTDLRGTVLAEADGTPRVASPFGRRDVHPALAAAIDYVEKGWDADLGLVRMGVRDYDPQLNRFTTPDPLFLERPDRCRADPRQCNLYGYAAGNPLSFVDPSGQYNELVHGVFTYEMAKLAGFTEDEAAEIAIGAASIDHDKATEPVSAANILSGATARWHFNPEAPDAFRDKVAANPFGDLFELGRRLHPAQDWGFMDLGPHQNWSQTIGHPFRFTQRGGYSWPLNSKVDSPANDPDRFRVEGRANFIELLKWASARGHGSTDPALMDKVNQIIEDYITLGAKNQSAVDQRFSNTPGMSTSYDAQLPRVLEGKGVFWEAKDTDRKQE